ncbi:hypothetical protein SAMN04489712_11532 [Thermomonospora echinospora]|uniref:Lipoprotein n=1 Tax=Thermomonospora echinospora TaxID=1992 RepID=A0A1H6DB40_9ACTN|nr:hypothetical protein [Thermomonospora echinospora]SEG82480.1 hypothetical protein SAMN04489712_11532 [Thermomonospora echinospora]
MRIRSVPPMVALASSLLLLPSCGSADQDDAGGKEPRTGEKISLTEEFKKARNQAKTDFERGIWDRAIKAGKISQADYEESFGRYRQCAQDAGYRETYTKQSNGTYRINPPSLPDDKSLDQYLKTTGDCAEAAGLTRVEALLRTQVDNPDRLADPREVVVRCLLKEGLISGDYTAEQLGKDAKDGFRKVPFDLADPRVKQCLDKGGYAVEVQGPRNGPGAGPEQTSGG